MQYLGVKCHDVYIMLKLLTKKQLCVCFICIYIKHKKIICKNIKNNRYIHINNIFMYIQIKSMTILMTEIEVRIHLGVHQTVLSTFL